MLRPFPKIIRIGTIYGELPKIINFKKLLKIAPVVILESQINSEKIQNIYETMLEYRDELFERIKNKIPIISKNIYGNQLIRVIINTKEKEKINIIFHKLKKNIKKFSLDDNVTFVIQELIKNVNKVQLRVISIELVRGNFEEFIQNENTKRVIQKLIISQDRDANNEICKKICNNFIPFCKNKYTSYIIETLLNKCNEYYYKKMFVNCINNFFDLIGNMYGCHIVCYFVQNNLNILFKLLINNIINISQIQFGVLIIRAIINNNKNPNLRNLFINIIKSNINILIFLSNNQYGNIVVQDILDFLDQNTKNYLKKKLQEKKNTKYSDYVLDKLI